MNIAIHGRQYNEVHRTRGLTGFNGLSGHDKSNASNMVAGADMPFVRVALTVWNAAASRAMEAACQTPSVVNALASSAFAEIFRHRLAAACSTIPAIGSLASLLASDDDGCETFSAQDGAVQQSQTPQGIHVASSNLTQTNARSSTTNRRGKQEEQGPPSARGQSRDRAAVAKTDAMAKENCRADPVVDVVLTVGLSTTKARRLDHTIEEWKSQGIADGDLRCRHWRPEAGLPALYKALKEATVVFAPESVEDEFVQHLQRNRDDAPRLVLCGLDEGDFERRVLRWVLEKVS